MSEFLLGSVVRMLPVFVFAGVVAESLLFVRERKGFTAELAVAASIWLVLVVLGQFQSHSSWAAENRPVLLATVNLLSVLMPLVVFVGTNQLLIRIQRVALKHGCLWLIVAFTMFLWPLWALFVTCTSGLDCL